MELNPLILVADNFIETIEQHPQLLYADTDSVLGETIINVNGKDIKIEEFYEEDGVIIPHGENNFVKNMELFNYITPSVNNDLQLEFKKISYCMKHKVKKSFYKIKTKDDHVTITEDHSLIVFRKGKLLSIKPKEVEKDDRLFKILK